MNLYKVAFLFCFCWSPLLSAPLNNSSKNYTLWVLSLNDGQDLRQIQSANSEDKRVFRNIVMPTIKHFQDLNSVMKENGTRQYEKPTLQPINSGNILKLQGDLVKILNKFSLVSSLEADNNGDLFMQPTLKIYFFGPFTSLIVNTGSQHLHYFIKPPSTLPQWFYENHGNVDKHVDIPEEIKYDLYEKLIALLHFFFSFPL